MSSAYLKYVKQAIENGSRREPFVTSLRMALKCAEEEAKTIQREADVWNRDAHLAQVEFDSARKRAFDAWKHVGELEKLVEELSVLEPAEKPLEASVKEELKATPTDAVLKEPQVTTRSPVAEFPVKVGQIWKNKKTRGVYMVEGFARCSETQQNLVIYAQQIPSNAQRWVRPLALFLEKFDPVD